MKRCEAPCNAASIHDQNNCIWRDSHTYTYQDLQGFISQKLLISSVHSTHAAAVMWRHANDHAASLTSKCDVWLLIYSLIFPVFCFFKQIFLTHFGITSISTQVQFVLKKKKNQKQIEHLHKSRRMKTAASLCFCCHDDSTVLQLQTLLLSAQH